MKTKFFTLFIAVLASVVSLNATIVDGIAYSFNKTDSTAQVIAGGTYSGHIVVPQYVRYKGVPFCVTSIGAGAFANSASLSSIALPNSVATIGDEAFKNCVNLDSCVLGKGLTSIGQDAFSECGSLVALVIYAVTPPIVASGNDIDKDWCILYLPAEDSTTYTTTDWWNEFPTISYTVDDYDTDNRSNEKELLNVQIGGVDVVIDDTIGIARLDWNVDVSSLPVTFSLPPYATADFTSGANHNFSAPLYITVTSERGTQKRYTFQTKRISENKCGDNVYYGVAGDTLYIEGIGAMYDYKSGTSQQSPFKTMSFSKVIVRNGVTTIGAYAFRQCTSLTSITISNSVTSIGSYALKNCTNLTSVTIEATIPPVVNNSFDSSLPAIYVPCGTINSYKTKWSKYSSKIQYKPLPISVEPSEYGVFTYPTVCDSLLSVTSNYGYHFVKWNDDNTDNPRVITADDTLTLGAEFAINPTITYLYDGTMGNVDGDTILAHSATGEASFTAIANQGYHFVQWSDDNTDNPRTAYIIQDTTFTAEFAINKYLLSLSVEDTIMGAVIGGGEYDYLTETNISAHANDGYVFYRWSDGNTDSLRTVSITKDINLQASFISVYDLKLKSILVDGLPIVLQEPYVYYMDSDYAGTPNILVIPIVDAFNGGIQSLTSTSFGWLADVYVANSIGDTIYYNIHLIRVNIQSTLRATLIGGSTTPNTNIVKTGSGIVFENGGVLAKNGSDSVTDFVGITGYKLRANGNYIALTLTNECFKAGDELNVYTTRSSDVTEKDGYMHFYSNQGNTPLFNIAEHEPGLYTYPLGMEYDGGTAIYLYRTGNNMNPYVSYMEVVRRGVKCTVNYNTQMGNCIEKYGHGTVTITATSNYGYHFTQWSDGNTENPRTIILTQDTTFTAEFAVDRSGKCGDDLALTWNYDETNKALTISGEGTLNSNYTFGLEAPTSAERLIIADDVTSIGNSAFADYSTLKHLSVAASVKTIREQAFYNCIGLQEIYSYRTTPPTAYSNTFDGIEKFECVLHVLSASVDMYKAATGWRDFYYVKTIDAEEVTVPLTKVEIEPHDNNVIVTWPTSDEATSYTLEITKDGVVFCTLIFNANGQLQGIAFAPGKNGTRQAPTAVMTSNGGLRFTVTGLDSGTNYHLTLDAKNELDEVVVSYDVDFETTGQADIPTGMEETDAETIPCKLLRNGQVFIQRGDKTYTLDGMEVK